MRKAIDRFLLTRLLQTSAISMAVMTASALGVCAETVIGADGADGASCSLDGASFCLGGDASDGQSVTAIGNPAVAIGGNGGAGGLSLPIGFGSGNGGYGGSATAVAEASAASGAVTAWASATGGVGGWSYFGPSWGGNASASATATSGDVTIAATAWVFGVGFENPGEPTYNLVKPHAYASATALSGSVSGDMITFGTVTVDANSDPYDESFTLSFFDPDYRGELFVNGVYSAYNPGGSVLTGYGPGEFVISGVVPQTPTWAMMLIGFAGLGFARYRSTRRTAAVGLRA